MNLVSIWIAFHLWSEYIFGTSKPITCSEHNSCSYTNLNGSTLNATELYCTGDASCYFSNISNFDNVYCFTDTCVYSQIYNVSTVHCNEIYSCLRAVIQDANKSYCTNTDACFGTTFINSNNPKKGNNNNTISTLANTVTCDGVSSCQDATFINISKISCKHDGACVSVTITNCSAVYCIKDDSCTSINVNNVSLISCKGLHSCTEMNGSFIGKLYCHGGITSCHGASNINGINEIKIDFDIDSAPEAFPLRGSTVTSNGYNMKIIAIYDDIPLMKIKCEEGDRCKIHGSYLTSDLLECDGECFINVMNLPDIVPFPMDDQCFSSSYYVVFSVMIILAAQMIFVVFWDISSRMVIACNKLLRLVDYDERLTKINEQRKNSYSYKNMYDDRHSQQDNDDYKMLEQEDEITSNMISDNTVDSFDHMMEYDKYRRTFAIPNYGNNNGGNDEDKDIRNDIEQCIDYFRYQRNFVINVDDKSVSRYYNEWLYVLKTALMGYNNNFLAKDIVDVILSFCYDNYNYNNNDNDNDNQLQHNDDKNSNSDINRRKFDVNQRLIAYYVCFVIEVLLPKYTNINNVLSLIWRIYLLMVSIVYVVLLLMMGLECKKWYFDHVPFYTDTFDDNDNIHYRLTPYAAYVAFANCLLMNHPFFKSICFFVLFWTLLPSRKLFSNDKSDFRVRKTSSLNTCRFAKKFLIFLYIVLFLGVLGAGAAGVILFPYFILIAGLVLYLLTRLMKRLYNKLVIWPRNEDRGEQKCHKQSILGMILGWIMLVAMCTIFTVGWYQIMISWIETGMTIQRAGTWGHLFDRKYLHALWYSWNNFDKICTNDIGWTLMPKQLTNTKMVHLISWWIF